MPAEFECCECGRHIISFTEDTPPEPPLCAYCLMLPGWFTVPDIRSIIDPEYSEGVLIRWKPIE